MAGNKSQVFKADILGLIVGKTTGVASLASTMWFHLYNTTLTDAATPATTGRVGTTAAADNYNPVNKVRTTATWTNPTTASPSATENKVEIVFASGTGASTGWGTVKAVMITSSSGTGGVAYYWADVSPNQVVAEGNLVKFSTGALDITDA